MVVGLVLKTGIAFKSRRWRNGVYLVIALFVFDRFDLRLDVKVQWVMGRQQLPAQAEAIRRRCRNAYINETSYVILITGKINDTIIFGSPCELFWVLARMSFNENFLDAANHGLSVIACLLGDLCLQAR